MITLQQDNDGFIRMERHFPRSAAIRIIFNDGSAEVCTGARVNEAYDDAVAVFRAKNHLDAKGFSRVRKLPANSKINAVPVTPGMGRRRFRGRRTAPAPAPQDFLRRGGR